MRTWSGALLVGMSLLLGCGECEDDFDCPGDRICRAGQCEAFVCKRHEDCAPAQVCSRNKCRAAPTVEPPPSGDPIKLPGAGG
jgi:hypothetical protein